jgi:hypothetical protein
MKQVRRQVLAGSALLLGCALSAQAGVIVSNGVTWELTSTALPGASSGTFTVSASTLDGWDREGTAWLGAFSLKNFGSQVQINGGNPGGITATGGAWDWGNEGLNAGGCKSNGTDDALCLYLTDGVTGTGNLDTAALGDAAAPNTGMASFSFSFDVDFVGAGGFPEDLHFKVNWWEEDCKVRAGVETCDGWKKVGDLISRDIGYGPGGRVADPRTIPLPGVLGLFGLGLVLLNRMSRDPVRRRQA